MIWFTSDTHFGHANIIKYCQRPFKDVREMDAALIQNWNACVKRDDEVYHLGDFALCDYYDYYLSQLNGKINFIEGNHDRGFWASNVWTKFRIQKLPPIKTMGFEVDGNKFTLTMSHYTLATWNRSHHAGNYHLFGHIHNSEIPWQHPMSKNVGVDMTNFKPISLVSLYNELSARPFESGFNYKSQ